MSYNRHCAGFRHLPNNHIPQKRERLILSDTVVKLNRLIAQSVRPHTAAHLDVASVLAAVTVGHLSGRPMTATKIALFIDMPRATVLDRLAFLIRHNHVIRRGRYYCVSPARIHRRSDLIDSAIAVILEAARKLSR